MRHARRSLAALVISAAASVASAATPDADPFDQLDVLPGDVQLAAVFDAPGAGWLREGSGLAATGLAGSTGLFARTRSSWSNLAETLGFTPEQADQALLGGTVVLGWRALEQDGMLATIGSADTGWVLVSEVDPPTAARVREKLRAVPRRIAYGTPVYSIDGGRIGMALVEAEQDSRLLIAPVENADLIDECLGRLRRGIGGPGPGAETRALLGPVGEDWSGIAQVRFGDGQPLPVAMVMRAEGRDVAVRFAARARAEAGAPVGLLDRIGGDALLAMVSGGDPLGTGPGVLRLGFSLQAIGDQQQAPPEDELRTGRGYALLIRQSSGSMTATVTAEGASDDGFTAAVDRAIARAIRPDAPPEFGGRFPDAVRTHAGGGDAAPGAWPGERSSIAWCMHADDSDRRGVFALSFGDARADTAQQARHAREAWSAGGDVYDAGVVSAGYALPARLVKAAGMDSGPAGVLGAAVERADWTVRQDGEIVRGEIRLRFPVSRARLGAE